MAASTFSVPLLCCSIPRACSSMPVADVPHHSAACSIARRRHPGDPAAHSGVIDATVAAACSKSFVWSAMKSWSSQSCSMTCVQHGAEQRRVRTRPHREEEVGGAGERHHPRVLDDQPRAPVAGPPDVARRDRERLRHVRSGDPDHVGERDVAPRVGVAVDAERLLVARPRRHHAEAAVVVEVGGVQGETGELADEVALLVGQRHPREHGEGIVAVGGLDAPDLAHDPIEGGVPVDRSETSRPPTGRAPSGAAAGPGGCPGGSASRPLGRACPR